jgi:long-subunit acyl-CoA synthetase (AMP-forming)
LACRRDSQVPLLIPLSSLLEDPGADASSVVFSRGNGVWNSSPRRFRDDVCCLAAALAGYGLREGGRAGVLGSEGYGTLRAGLAVIAAGATLVPLDPALSDDALRRALAASGAVHAIASDERQLARLLALRPDLSALELLLLMSAAPSERKPAALLVETAIEVGKASLAADRGQLRAAFAASEGGAACLLVDAAGETQPVARTTLQTVADAFSQILGNARGKTVLSSLPVAGVARLGASLAALSQGATLLLPDPAERPDAGLGQHPADAVLLDVTSLERLFRAWKEDIDAKSWMGRNATRWALREGRSAPSKGWKRRLAEALALRGLREKLGGRASGLEVVADGGRRASDEVNAFFAALGLSLRYISTVTGGALAR